MPLAVELDEQAELPLDVTAIEVELIVDDPVVVIAVLPERPACLPACLKRHLLSEILHDPSAYLL